jgi:two-component system nitrate/nitrite response regulator NarL
MASAQTLNGAPATLTPREHEILEMLARGSTGEQIARELFLSPETVQKHVHNAKRKVGAETRAHLIALACARGLIDPASLA